MYGSLLGLVLGVEVFIQLWTQGCDFPKEADESHLYQPTIRTQTT